MAAISTAANIPCAIMSLDLKYQICRILGGTKKDKASAYAEKATAEVEG